jgi:glucose/arabinose dehydrogenase
MKNMRFLLKVVFLFHVGFFSQAAVNAQPVIGYQTITTGLVNPVDVVSAPGDSRLFIAQQNGNIRIWNGTGLSDFVNIGSVVTSPAAGEQGLLSIAFHPAYNINRYFFVWYTNTNGDVTLARYQRNLTNPDIADVGSAQVLLSIPKPGNPYYTNHNGGKLVFGPDGMLYVGTGDGGSGGDPLNNAQSGNSLLGKMLRLDVNGFATAPPYYTIPADNPYASPADGILDEIYAIGLRNPWRWSFDRANGDMWIADVGQSEWEEVNWLPAGNTAGANFGWRCYEGAHVYGAGCNPAPADTVSPVFEYGHNNTTGGFSITGGYVYRGSEFPALQGYYITTDYVSTNLWLIKPNGSGGFASSQQSGVLDRISSFGEAADGTLYAVRRTTGTLYKVIVTSVVPVRLTRFSGVAGNGFNELSWESTSEINTKFYHLEYSSDGVNFSRLIQIPATSNTTGSQYRYRHTISRQPNMYYRLAIEDADGSLRYSSLVLLKDSPRNEGNIYPSFISNGTMEIIIKKPFNHLQLLNSNGAMVYQKNMQGISGTVRLYLPALPAGIYILKAKGKKEDHTRKLLIQK